MPRTLAIAALCAALIPTMLASGCAALVVGGVGTGVSVVHDRRSAGTQVEDQNIELRSYALLREHPQIADKSNISVTSYNLTVLLTGQAADAETAQRFAELVAGLPAVKKVYNEVAVGTQATFGDDANDAYVTSKVKVALLEVKAPDFDPTRVKVVTSQGVVYLMGLLTPTEAEQTTEKARYVGGVRRVVKLFEMVSPSEVPAPGPQ
jgi:osmotically-inducible protein OsmY